MSNLSRRGFLSRLVAATAAVTATSFVDPEQLLWVPGAKTIFIPDQVTPKNVALVTDEKMLAAEYKALTQGEFAPNKLSGDIDMMTAMGRATFDRATGLLLTLGGRVVSASEAAHAQLSGFTGSRAGQVGTGQSVDILAANIAAARVRSGRKEFIDYEVDRLRGRQGLLNTYGIDLED